MTVERRIIHVDMDAFYASVEVRDNPALAGKPVLVGGAAGHRGVVAACSYESRTFGVHSAMPMSQAIRLCPQAVVLPVRMGRYAEVSKQIHHIFYRYTPDVEPLSLDEAFLDVTGCLGLFGCAETIGKKIKWDIKEQTGLTASVGVAPNKFLAKLASDLKKPDGFVVLAMENIQPILDPMAVSKLWGIGKVTANALQRVGVRTIFELRTAPRHVLSMVLGNCVEDILRLAQGIDDRPVEPYAKAKSVSMEETFSADIQDKEVLMGVLMHQIEVVSQQLRVDKIQARTIVLKIRYGDFKTITRSVTMDKPTHTTKIFLQEAGELLTQWHKKSAGPLRLLGFGVSGLSSEGDGQQLLFSDPEEEKQKKVDAAFDKIREKYGDDSVKRGNR